MSSLEDMRIAILATEGFEESELLQPREMLERAGASTDVVSLSMEPIRSWAQTDWGAAIAVEAEVSRADPSDYDALVIPGGRINPDKLRADARAVAFVKAFADAGKPIGAICHGPWLLVESGAAKGRQLTSWPSLKTDIRNAGGEWVDAEVVVDRGIITSRKPDDIPAFANALIETIAEAAHAS